MGFDPRIIKMPNSQKDQIADWQLLIESKAQLDVLTDRFDRHLVEVKSDIRDLKKEDIEIMKKDIVNLRMTLIDVKNLITENQNKTLVSLLKVLLVSAIGGAGSGSIINFIVSHLRN